MKIYTLGGYEKVGSNMTAVEVDDQIVIFDMGLDIEKVIEYDGEVEGLNTKEIIDIGAVADDQKILKKKEKVKGIVVNHGHLDHTGGIPKLVGKYDCPIIGTGYTLEIIKRLIKQDKRDINNDLIQLNPGNTLSLDAGLELEFINITHSIPGAVISVLNTVEGKIAYALDSKLDENPTLGQKPNFERLEKLRDENLKVLIGDSTRVEKEGTTGSEKEAQIKLRHTIDKAYRLSEGVIISSFSSHIARLKNIIKANNNRREIIIVGRSLKEYTSEAERLGIIDLSDIKVVSRRRKVEKALKKAGKNKEEYLIICTGNQGEKNAVLSRIARDEYPYRIKENDTVIFSSTVIPTHTTRANRQKLEKNIKDKGARMYKNVHVYGHGLKEDQRDLIKLTEPENIIPAHGDTEKLSSFASMAKEEGYNLGEDVFISQNGRVIKL